MSNHTMKISLNLFFAYLRLRLRFVRFINLQFWPTILNTYVNFEYAYSKNKMLKFEL